LRKYLEYVKRPANVKSIIQSLAGLDYGFAFREMFAMKTESIALSSSVERAFSRRLCASARDIPQSM
jgi:hypothetical protein